MERLTCDYCGLPFRTPTHPPAGTPSFCCSGCALASQLGIEKDGFPVTPSLVRGLIFAFGAFNQLLLVLLGLALQREGRFEAAALCRQISAALGALLFGAALIWQVRARWLAVSDAFVFALLVGPLAAGVFLAWSQLANLGVWLATGANLGLGGWQARGFLRRRWGALRGSGP